MHDRMARHHTAKQHSLQDGLPPNAKSPVGCEDLTPFEQRATLSNLNPMQVPMAREQPLHGASGHTTGVMRIPSPWAATAPQLPIRSCMRDAKKGREWGYRCPAFQCATRPPMPARHSLAFIAHARSLPEHDASENRCASKETPTRTKGAVFPLTKGTQSKRTTPLRDAHLCPNSRFPSSPASVQYALYKRAPSTGSAARHASIRSDVRLTESSKQRTERQKAVRNYK